MADPVEIAFVRTVRTLVPSGASVLAAVSGGGDSVALLHLLRRYAVTASVDVTVAHLDHGLRRGSGADRRFVERLALDLSLPWIAERRDVASQRRKDESPEESARRVRRQFLLESAAAVGADRIATGHTLDDQAETILMRLVRGAGATALTGMAASGPGPFVRPLLELERPALRRYLDRKGLEFRRDPSNRDLRFDRNRVRRLVLPVLAETLNPRAARHLVKAARLLREDTLYLDALAREQFDRLSHQGRRRLVLDSRRLEELEAPLAKRVARLALGRAGADARRVAARHVDAILGLATGPGGRRVNLPGGLVASRKGRELVIRREG